MAEEIGKRVAEELSSRFTQICMKVRDQQSSVNLGAQALAALNHLIPRELRGFNQVAPPGFRLNMLPGQSCLVFSFHRRLALTLKVEGVSIRLVSAPSQLAMTACDQAPLAGGHPCLDFRVSRDDAGFHFQQIARLPSAYTPVFSEGQFVEGILRVACGQSFERN